ncbi:unnamed protein product [Adineta steineri]|uniref:NAD(P)(+)--arginine ADP-ribosyltransferase n=1 Tax=Adineta steineri TaxID=433720 RepID=A0A819GYV3_9BILA|nr:unnamed protein product [Adineta steineri]
MSFSFEINPRFFIDISHQPQENIESINDYQQEELLSLEQACQPLENLLGTELQLYITVAKLNSKQPKHGLTQDESASIYLYTMEWSQPQNSLHIVLNQVICTMDRNELQHWFKYLKLLFTAFSKLPYSEYHTVWRGVAKDSRENYREGDEVTWWSLTSVTSSFDILQSPMYLGREKVQTIFKIETKHGKSIQEHSHLQNDDEIILLPRIPLEVTGLSKQGDGIHIIHLREKGLIDDTLMNVSEPVDTYHNPKLEKIIRSAETRGELVLNSRNLNDRDMEIVVRLGIIEKKCRILRLRNNAITSIGISIMSQVFVSGRYFLALILDGNRILDEGVRIIARGLSNEDICCRTLYLKSVGMSDVGCEYLAEMLRVNHAMWHLYLSDNDISDRGLRLLLDATRSYENGLETITLSGNRRITDASVDVICSAMRTRHDFFHFILDNCGISTEGQEQIERATKGIKRAAE